METEKQEGNRVVLQKQETHGAGGAASEGVGRGEVEEENEKQVRIKLAFSAMLKTMDTVW